MTKRSLDAQIDAVVRVLDNQRCAAKYSRNGEFGQEHVLRLECALNTLQWVRDHTDVVRQLTVCQRASETQLSTAGEEPAS